MVHFPWIHGCLHAYYRAWTLVQLFTLFTLIHFEYSIMFLVANHLNKRSYFLVQCSCLPQAKVNTPEIGLGIIILVSEKETSRSNLGNFFADLLIFHLF